MDYPADLSFSPQEIETMLTDYSRERKNNPEIPAIASRLYYFTAGYPFLVSRLCAIIDGEIMKPEETGGLLEYVDQSVAIILRENNTNFESLIKNLENHGDL